MANGLQKSVFCLASFLVIQLPNNFTIPVYFGDVMKTPDVYGVFNVATGIYESMCVRCPVKTIFLPSSFILIVFFQDSLLLM